MGTGAGPGAPSVADEVSAFREGLARVDVGALSDAERVELVAELERVKGAASAAQARTMHPLRTSLEAASVRGSTAGRGGSGLDGGEGRLGVAEPGAADPRVGLEPTTAQEPRCT
ncbi:MAG TPA: hypothetical protein VFN34_00330 [Ornithinibacter sp.]|nr:hypothetical protein [Ornithinibacter sp.]